MLFKLVLLSLSIGFLESRFLYEGYSLLKLTPQTSSHIKLIENWQNIPNFDIWNRIKGINHGVDVLLSPEDKIKFIKLFKLANLPYNVTVENIKEKIIQQERSNNVQRLIRQSIVGTFARYSEIQSYLDGVVKANPSLASTYIAGQTYEKRNISVLVIKTPTKPPSVKSSVWIDCGIHAREWITPATCVYMIDKFISEYKTGVKSTVTLLNKYEIHIVPLLNPDGYEYSQTYYRFWRKNRNPNLLSSCVGTDLNRNSGYQWMTGGSSNNPCSDTYAGKSANSELEIKAMQSALTAKRGKWKAYFTLHTYGQWIFSPWGYTYDLPSDYSELIRVGKIGANAIKSVNGLKFVVGSSTHLLSIGSGGSEDWAKGALGIKYSYCLELRPTEYGTDSQYGFNLPASKIPLAGSETYEGIKAMLAAIPPN